MSDHAYLGCSKSEQWINCPPSVKLEQRFPDERSVYAEEGRRAHELAEICLHGNQDTKDFPDYPIEMRESVQAYLEYVRAIPHSLMNVEIKLDVSAYVPEGFGTADVILIDGSTIHVIDLKYGKGVEVEVENNPQAMLYGVGAIEEYDMIYGPFNHVVMHIVQPRIGNFKSWSIDFDDLVTWAETVVAPKAQLAFKGEGEFKAGKHCKFCKARHTCRARADMMLASVKPEGELLSDEELAALYPKLAQIVSWANDLQDQALKRAEAGNKLPGLKLVEGRSSRSWSDENAVIERLTAAGFEDIYTTKLLSITAVESLVGKKEFVQLLGDVVTKPPGKPTLVPLEDKRSELSTHDAALGELLNT